MRGIVVFENNKDIFTFVVETLVEIPDNAAITITTCCGDCDWCVRASMGRKPACGHPRIQAARPYAEKGEKGRSVEYETRPSWCPL